MGGGSDRVGMTTRSRPAGRWAYDRRNASRTDRFQRLRATAFPTRRDTARPSRVTPPSYEQPNTRTAPPRTEFPAAKTRSNSVPLRSRSRFGNEAPGRVRADEEMAFVCKLRPACPAGGPVWKVSERHHGSGWRVSLIPPSISVSAVLIDSPSAAPVGIPTDRWLRPDAEPAEPPK